MAFIDTTEGLAASKNIIAVAYRELENNPAPAWIKQVFWIILSKFQTEIIAFSKGVPGMREWVGERRIQSLSQYAVSITKKDWELTVGVDRDDIQFDHFNIILPQIQGMATAYLRHIVVDYFVNLCLNGSSVEAYDGQYFFDSDHPNHTGTYDNVTSSAFDATTYAAAKLEAAKIRNNDTGTSLSINYDWLFYGPTFETAVDTVFAQRQASGTDNLNFNKIPAERRIRVDEFGDTNIAVLFDLSKFLKPFALQVVKGINFVPFDKPDDWVVFTKKEFIYGQDSQDNATYVLPELAYRFGDLA